MNQIWISIQSINLYTRLYRDFAWNVVFCIQVTFNQSRNAGFWIWLNSLFKVLLRSLLFSFKSPLLRLASTKPETMETLKASCQTFWSENSIIRQSNDSESVCIRIAHHHWMLYLVKWKLFYSKVTDSYGQIIWMTDKISWAY